MKQVNHKMLPKVQICSDSFHKRLARKLRCESRARKAKTLCNTQSENWVPVMRETFILITVQDFTVWKLIHLYQFSQTKDELFLETIMTVAFLLHLTHLREIDKGWTTQQGLVLERGKDCQWKTVSSIIIRFLVNTTT